MSKLTPTKIFALLSSPVALLWATPAVAQEETPSPQNTVSSCEGETAYAGALCQDNRFRVSSVFGGNRNIRTANGGESRGLHRGVDAAAPQGTPLRAPVDLLVLDAPYDSKNGYRCIVTPILTNNIGNNLEIHYLHMESACLFSAGERIPAGETMGYVGSTGNSTGPHTHIAFKYRLEESRLIRADTSTVYIDPVILENHGGIDATEARVRSAALSTIENYGNSVVRDDSWSLTPTYIAQRWNSWFSSDDSIATPPTTATPTATQNPYTINLTAPYGRQP